MKRIALATAIAAFGLDEDEPLLRHALHGAGACCEALAWDDATVSWSRFDAVVLRSTWNYTRHRDAFLLWCDAVAAASTLINPPDLVRWNTDKHYLRDLAARGVPVIPSAFLSPGDDAAALPVHDECVVKPTVGAGSQSARRFQAHERDAAVAHTRALLDAGSAVMVQPYLDAVDRDGETALVYIDGAFSHAIRKAPLLARGGGAMDHLFAPESITPREPSDAERAVAARALAAIPGEAPLYARVDLLPSPDGPLLLELELTEPSLFLAHADTAAPQRFAHALLGRLGG